MLSQNCCLVISKLIEALYDLYLYCNENFVDVAVSSGIISFKNKDKMVFRHFQIWLGLGTNKTVLPETQKRTLLKVYSEYLIFCNYFTIFEILSSKSPSLCIPLAIYSDSDLILIGSNFNLILIWFLTDSDLIRNLILIRSATRPERGVIRT